MAKKIDEAQVKKVAKLSRLDLTDAEVEEFAGQLSRVYAKHCGQDLRVAQRHGGDVRVLLSVP